MKQSVCLLKQYINLYFHKERMKRFLNIKIAVIDNVLLYDSQSIVLRFTKHSFTHSKTMLSEKESQIDIMSIIHIEHFNLKTIQTIYILLITKIIRTKRIIGRFFVNLHTFINIRNNKKKTRYEYCQ